MALYLDRTIVMVLAGGRGSRLEPLTDIRAKWGKFSEDELGALKNNDDLVTQIVAKYSLDKAQAVQDVNAVLKGRQI